MDNSSDAHDELKAEYSHVYFPKEYQRSLLDMVDKRFAMIWLLSFFVHFSTALYFTINPPDTSINRSEIDRIQKQFATFVLSQKIVEQIGETEIFPDEEEEAVEVGDISVSNKMDEGTGKSGLKSGTASGGELATVTSRKGDYASGAEKRRSSQEQISKEVSSKGLLGLLTGSGNNAKGESINDVLGNAAENQGDLDKVLGNLDGIKSTGNQSSGTGSGTGSEGEQRSHKETRSTTSGGIDDLIAGKEQATASNIERKGTIVVEKVSSVADERGIKSESRDPDKVSEVINRHNSSIQYCYQRELKQNPDLRGKIVVRFTITPEGKIKEVKLISSTLNNPSVERCIISRIRRWDDFGPINPSKGDATFRQVYTFGY